MQKYSEIITPEKYNRIMTNQHLYIHSAEMYVRNQVDKQAQSSCSSLEVVEPGCGPGRVTQLIAPIENIKLTGLDIDSEFIQHARALIKTYDRACIVNADILTYKHDKPVDILYTSGVHHHIEKGEKTKKYLSNLYEMLAANGKYYLVDEFIPEYNNEEERALRLIIWYAHIVFHAQRNSYHYLAQEEAKTLLDDLHQGKIDGRIKSNDQIQLVLGSVGDIDTAARSNNMEEANEKARKLMAKIDGIKTFKKSKDKTIDLSRMDYKICQSVFKKEITEVGFQVTNITSFGPIDSIGALQVYTLEK